MQNITSGLWDSSYPILTITFQKGLQPGEKVVSSNVSVAAFDFLQLIPRVTVGLSALQFPTWNQAYQQMLGPVINAGNIVSVDILLLSRIVLTDLLGSSAGHQAIANFVPQLP